MDSLFSNILKLDEGEPRNLGNAAPASSMFQDRETDSLS